MTKRNTKRQKCLFLYKERDEEMSENYKFFQNDKCEYFPCHKTNKPEDFNCLFCYCPLYALGPDCGGNYKYLENGIKSCEDCMFPHVKENYGKVNARFKDIVEVMKK